MASSKGMWDYDHLFYFRYRSKLFEQGKLDVYDQFPLVVPVKIYGNRLLGVNTHWLSRSGKKRFIEWIIDNSKRLPRNKLARLVYGVLKSDPRLSPTGLRAIRVYLNFRTNILSRITKQEIEQFDSPEKIKRAILFRKHKRKMKRRKS